MDEHKIPLRERLRDALNDLAAANAELARLRGDGTYIYEGTVAIDGGILRVGDAGYLTGENTRDLCFDASTGDGSFEVFVRRPKPGGCADSLIIIRRQR